MKPVEMYVETQYYLQLYLCRNITYCRNEPCKNVLVLVIPVDLIIETLVDSFDPTVSRFLFY